MVNTLLLIYAGTKTHSDMGRITNALVLAKELKQNGHTVHIAFDGAGVQWAEKLEGHEKLGDLYASVKDSVTSACDFCVGAFDADVSDDLKEDSFEGHQSFAKYFEEDWKILTF